MQVKLNAKLQELLDEKEGSELECGRPPKSSASEVRASRRFWVLFSQGPTGICGTFSTSAGTQERSLTSPQGFSQIVRASIPWRWSLIWRDFCFDVESDPGRLVTRM